MTKNLEEQKYVVTLDDDPMVASLISKIIMIKSISFEKTDKLLRNIDKLNPEAAFIDINLGLNESGLDVVPQIKERWVNCPIIVITSYEASSFIGDALASGADDFIVKPLRKAEVLARYRARRRQHLQLSKKNTINFSDINLFPLYRKLQGPKGEAFLTPIEQNILQSLIENDGDTLERSLIKRQVWGNIVVSDSALDRHIHGLKHKLKECSLAVKLGSIYGKGYNLNLST